MKRKRIIRDLKEILETATMKNANFDSQDESITTLIKDKTESWRRSWIIEPLSRIIFEIESSK